MCALWNPPYSHIPTSCWVGSTVGAQRTLPTSMCIFRPSFVPSIRLSSSVPSPTMSAQINPKTPQVVRLCTALMLLAYFIAAFYWLGRDAHLTATLHAVMALLVIPRMFHTVVSGPSATEAIRASYMLIWKAFYAEYLLLLVCLVELRA